MGILVLFMKKGCEMSPVFSSGCAARTGRTKAAAQGVHARVDGLHTHYALHMDGLYIYIYIGLTGSGRGLYRGWK